MHRSVAGLSSRPNDFDTLEIVVGNTQGKGRHPSLRLKSELHIVVASNYVDFVLTSTCVSRYFDIIPTILDNTFSHLRYSIR